MKIKGMRIDGFGIWRDLTIESIPEGMTVFFGRNEAGKSTLMQFIRTCFFGFPKERREKYMPPVYGGTPGGRLQLQRVEGGLEIQRTLDLQRPSDDGDVIITTSEGSASGQSRLKAIMNEVDEPIFNHVFAIGLQEIQELGALNDTQAADHLYRLTSGFDRVSLIDVLREIRQQREKLVHGDWYDVNHQLGRLLKRRKDLLIQIDGLVAGGRRWAKIAAHAKDFSRQLAEVEQKLAATDQESRQVEMAMQIAERWQNRCVIEQQIAAFGALPDLALIDIPRLDQLNQELLKQRDVVNNQLVERKHLRQSVGSIPINRVLWKNRNRIEALGEHVPWLESVEREIAQLEEQRTSAQQSVKEIVAEIQRNLGVSQRDSNLLTQNTISSLHGVARGIREDRERLNRAENEVREAEIEVKHLRDTLESARAHAGVLQGAPSTLEDTSRLANRLRKRTELDKKIEALETSRREMQRDLDVVVENQELPASRLVVIGAVALTGLLLIIIATQNGLSEDASNTIQPAGLLMFLMGAVGLLFAYWLKQSYERNSRDELNDFLHQIELVRQQLKRARQTRDELDAELPPGVSHWETRLREAEGQIGKMEEIIPLENKLHASQQHLETLKLKRDKIEGTLKKAQRHWRETLKGLNLPEKLKPAEIKDLSRLIQKLETWRSTLEESSQRLAEKQNEHRVFCARIHALAEETQLAASENHPQKRLAELQRLVRSQRELIERREKLAAEFKKLRSNYHAQRARQDKLQASKRRLLSAAGATTEEQFRDFAHQHQQRAKLRDKLDAVDEQIRAALGGHFQWEVVVGLVQRHGPAGLERVWDKLVQDAEGFKKRISELTLERGKLLQEMDSLSSNEGLEIARLEWSAVEQQIHELTRKWQQLAVVNQLLESIREQHEKLRQPETLKEASKYLEELTDGEYTRIWTRLVGENLFVDHEGGQAINVELLSRGTREAVFLALRLALVSAYARRGITLPMVLDDVLVNFDEERCHCAATVLAKFAKTGYQVLMFTCHHHIHQTFSRNGVSVQALPHHRDVIKTEGGAVVRVDSDDEWDYLVDEPLEPEYKDDLDDELPAPSPEALVDHESPKLEMWWEAAYETAVEPRNGND
ncbi:MAG: AAA family ATPase [Planctomycetaceae bacterium]|nr:AAA family ATPase [Planctomycetaceae bacterium]